MLATSRPLHTERYQISNYSPVFPAQHPTTVEHSIPHEVPPQQALHKQEPPDFITAALWTTLGPQGHDLQLQAERKKSSPSKDADNQPSTRTRGMQARVSSLKFQTTAKVLTVVPGICFPVSQGIALPTLSADVPTRPTLNKKKFKHWSSFKHVLEG